MSKTFRRKLDLKNGRVVEDLVFHRNGKGD